VTGRRRAPAGLVLRGSWLVWQRRTGHARILLRRTREVLAADGPVEVVRRTRRWLLAGPTHAGRQPLVQGHGTAAIEARYARRREDRDPGADELERQRIASASFRQRPLVSVAVPVFDPPLHVLRAMVASVLGQTYDALELCLANAGRDSGVAAYLDELAAREPRVRLAQLGENRGIAANSNAALELATGDFVALVDHDDVLAPHALYAVVEAIDRVPAVDVLYTDEDRLDSAGRRVIPFLKPDWSPELLHSFMWTGHLTVYRRSLLSELGGFRAAYEGSQDYDLMLRAAAVTDRIVHVPEVLYHWRMVAGSAAAGGKREARRTNLAALRDAIAARSLEARVAEYPSANRVVFALRGRPLVSIVVPTDDLELARTCVKGILAHTSYGPFEIVVVTNGHVADELRREFGDAEVRSVVHEGPFNFSRKCNLGAEAAGGTYLLFLNDDVEPLSEGWIESMLQYAQLPAIGGVSPKLLYADHTIQYAGLVTGVRDLVGTAFHTWGHQDGSYNGMALVVRNVSCLTGACLLLRADVFRHVGGWDTVNTPISHSDFDLSFRLLEAGFRLVYTPFAELRHLGARSRGGAPLDLRTPEGRAERGADVYLLRRWGPRVAEDPHYPEGMRALLYEDATDYRVLAPPAREQPPGWWERPRVLLVSHDLSATGAPSMLLEVAKALERSGITVVVTSPLQGPLASAYLELGVPVVVDGEILERPERAARCFRGFDVVAVNTVLGWRSILAADALGTPTVWFVHEPRFGVKMLAEAGSDIRRVLHAAGRIVFPSHATAELYERYGDAARHRIVNYGIPDAAREAGTEPAFDAGDDRFHIAHVGSVEPRKGAHVLVDAVRHLPTDTAKRVRVMLVGRPHDPDYVAKLAEEIRALPNVTLVGEKRRPDTLAHIRDSDLLVCTSTDEATPVVLFEAMALGTPFVTTPVGGVPEILHDGLEAAIVPFDDPAALARRIEQLVADADARRRLAEEGRRAYERSFTAARYGAAVTSIVREVLAEAGEAPSPG
jgi:glycosyltransferase involved in cell wall biosynthesis